MGSRHRLLTSGASDIFSFNINTNNISTGSTAANQFALPTSSGGTYNFNVDWGDGTNNNIITWNDPLITHTYSAAGTYTIKITGQFRRIYFNNTGDRLKILEVNSWGVLEIGAGVNSFQGCANLNLSFVTDVLDLTTSTTMYNLFAFCSSITTINNISLWNTSTITDMFGCFLGATLFNDNVNSWNVQNVTSFYAMFQGAINFNQPLSNWNTSACISFRQMFFGATAFNQSIGNFNVSNSSSFYQMFNNATAFNNGGSSNINNWIFSTTSNISFELMFTGATVFNQPIGNWNTNKVTTMANAFQNTTAFNQSLNTWDVSNVTNMSYMFNGTAAYNQPVNLWNTIKVTNFSNMFSSNTKFNQNIGNFNMVAATTLFRMFYVNNIFNNGGVAGIGNWVFGQTNVTLSGMFINSTAFNQPVLSWNMINVSDISGIFSGASAFNQTLNTWNTSNITAMNQVFQNATAFNQPIGDWNVSNVTDFTNFMGGKTAANYSAANLDLIYNGWSSRPVKPSLTINFNTIKYTAAGQAGRDILVGVPNLWTIVDGGI